MAVKIADVLAPLGDFPAALAQDIDFNDGESLQQKFDAGVLGGGTPAGNVLTDELKAQYDEAYTKAHEHANKDQLDKIGEDVDGAFTYDGVKVITDLSEYPTKTEMAEAIAAAEHLKRVKVDVLPDVADADLNTIYMMARADGSGDDIYSEYMIVDGAWEVMGNTHVDFTGYATEEYVNTALADYMLTTDVNSALDTKLNIAQDVAEAGKFAVVGDDGNITFVEGGGGGTAETTTYTNDKYVDYSNVALALDAILDQINYVAPKITSFTVSPATTEYEIGTTVDANALTFNWAVNKDITSQTLTDCAIELADRTASYGAQLAATKTFTLSVGDGKQQASSSIKISFLNKAYWGSSVQQAAYDSAFILGLSEKKFATGKAGSYTMTVLDGENGFIALPKSFGVVEFGNIGGFDTDLYNCGDVEFENASGHIEAYTVYRTGQKGLGKITIVLK